MPFHALVTQPSRRPHPATALARDRVARSGQRPPGSTLTLLTAAAWHAGVAMVTGGTPGQKREKKFKRAKQYGVFCFFFA